MKGYKDTLLQKMAVCLRLAFRGILLGILQVYFGVYFSAAYHLSKFGGMKGDAPQESQYIITESR